MINKKHPHGLKRKGAMARMNIPIETLREVRANLMAGQSVRGQMIRYGLTESMVLRIKRGIQQQGRNADGTIPQG